MAITKRWSAPMTPVVMCSQLPPFQQHIQPCLTATGSAKAGAEDQLSGALKSLFAVAENYPQLKANENFAKLQDELTDTEDKIQAARRFYNGNVRDLNTAIQTFPTNLMANSFGFKPMEFFGDLSETEKQPVKVQF